MPVNCMKHHKDIIFSFLNGIVSMVCYWLLNHIHNKNPFENSKGFYSKHAINSQSELLTYSS